MRWGQHHGEQLTGGWPSRTSRDCYWGTPPRICGGVLAYLRLANFGDRDPDGPAFLRGALDLDGDPIRKRARLDRGACRKRRREERLVHLDVHDEEDGHDDDRRDRRRTQPDDAAVVTVGAEEARGLTADALVIPPNNLRALKNKTPSG